MLFKKAEESMLASINALNGTFFKPGQLLFGPGQDINEIVPKPNTTKNSTILVRVADNAPYTGQSRLYYDRLDFGVVMANTPLNTYAKLRAYRPTSIHDLVPYLNDYYGFNITPADILDGPLELNNGSGTALIKANPRSQGWRGEFTVTIAPGDAKLEQWLTDTDLSGVEYPSGQSEKGQGEVYSYRYDCSEHWQALRELVVPEGGMLVPQAIADLLVEITGDDWGFVPGDYSLVEAMITYNGANTSDLRTNQDYSQVLLIELGAPCANLAGLLQFHYNTDADINANATVFSVEDNLNAMSSFDPRVVNDPAYAYERVNPYFYTAENDYTGVASLLSGIPWQSTWTNISSVNGEKLRDALLAVDGRAWVYQSTLAEYNTYNSYVEYNGPVANCPESVLMGLTVDEAIREGFTHVMILQIPYQYQSNLWYGKAFLHYNA